MTLCLPAAQLQPWRAPALHPFHTSSLARTQPYLAASRICPKPSALGCSLFGLYFWLLCATMRPHGSRRYSTSCTPHAFIAAWIAFSAASFFALASAAFFALASASALALASASAF